MKIAQGILPFQLVEDKSKSLLTSFAGVPLVMETFRALGLKKSIEKHLSVLEREGKFSESDYVESFVAVLSSGGDCLEDFEQLRSDEGLRKLGLRVPSPESARFFLNAFHDESALEGRPSEGAFIPEETELLRGLEKVDKDLIRRAVKGENPTRATIDIDAMVTESHKREAFWTYLGEKGYQPITALWAEKDLILTEEFRDGNVPCGMNLLSVLKKAIDGLPDSVKELYLRSDSAGYVHEVLNFCREEIDNKPRILFAISADMSEELREKVLKVREENWKPLKKMTKDGLVEGRKEWAEVEFVPSAPSVKKHMKPDRYLAIRVRPYQKELFNDGNPYHYYAIVSNMWSWDGERLIRWQRERCGTIEKTNDVLKNDLGAGVLPCKRFFANSTWYRLNCITYNIISVMKRIALPQSWWSARLKALRFHLLRIAGRVIESGRRIYLRLSHGHQSFNLYAEARSKLLIFSSA